MGPAPERGSRARAILRSGCAFLSSHAAQAGVVALRSLPYLSSRVHSSLSDRVDLLPGVPWNTPDWWLLVILPLHHRADPELGRSQGLRSGDQVESLASRGPLGPCRGAKKLGLSRC